MTEAVAEDHETRLKRLRLRCWRRGTKEMDLLFGPFADRGLRDLTAEDLDAFEVLMEENDQDLYLWISGAADMPPAHEAIITQIRTFHDIGK